MTKMQTIILSAFSAPGVTIEWRDIVKVVEAKSKRPIKNWLTGVRNHLQGLLNAGILVRIQDSSIEGYCLVASSVTS